MSLLSHDELVELVRKGILEGSNEELVNSASIDIRLGKKILMESASMQHVSLARKEAPRWEEWDLEKDGPTLILPGQFILAQSLEIFHLPNNISAEYKLKSSMARIGLDHLNAGWCDAGWNGSVLTLELKNVSESNCIELRAGDRIGQMIFFRHQEVPSDRSYAARGRYNNNLEVSGVRPDPRKVIISNEDEDGEEDNEPISIDLGSPFDDENYDDANRD